ncbi:hypothetical protein TURU_001890 [Turdus rufiventris]|nr:hypothetical protein TURU_001890 [Turdus rufiventris]
MASGSQDSQRRSWPSAGAADPNGIFTILRRFFHPSPSQSIPVHPSLSQSIPVDPSPSQSGFLAFWIPREDPGQAPEPLIPTGFSPFRGDFSIPVYPSPSQSIPVDPSSSQSIPVHPSRSQ